MRKLKAVKCILLDFSVHGMERLLQCQQAGPEEITTTLPGQEGRLTSRINRQQGIDSA
jgi:hypothetical protein